MKYLVLLDYWNSKTKHSIVEIIGTFDGDKDKILSDAKQSALETYHLFENKKEISDSITIQEMTSDIHVYVDRYDENEWNPILHKMFNIPDEIDIRDDGNLCWGLMNEVASKNSLSILIGVNKVKTLRCERMLYDLLISTIIRNDDYEKKKLTIMN